MTRFQQGQVAAYSAAAALCEECERVCLTNMDAYDASAAACYRFRADDFKRMADEVCGKDRRLREMRGVK